MSNISRRAPVSILSLSTDADLFTAADGGELWHVEAGAARPVRRDEVACLAHDDEYASSWVIVRAPSAAEALEVAATYDSHSVRSLERGLRDADQVLALVEA